MFEDNDGQWRPLSGTDSSMLLIKHVEQERDLRLEPRARRAGAATSSPTAAARSQLQAGDLDAMLVNLAIARDVAAGKPLNYRMVDDGRAKQMGYQVAGKETDHGRRQVAAGDQGHRAPTATSRP